MVAVGGADPGPCSIQKIVEGAKRGLIAFNSWSCSHVRRQCNMASHLMAKEAINVRDCLIWVEDTQGRSLGSLTTLLVFYNN